MAPTPRPLVSGVANISGFGMVLIHLVAATLDPPARYPDIFTYAMCIWSFLHVVVAWLALAWIQLRLPRPGKAKPE